MNVNLTQPRNLAWLTPQHHQMQGYWLAVEPTPAAWNTIQKVQQFVREELEKEKITSWAPYSHKISHVSVFLGFNEKTTAQEKSAVMRRVAEKIAGLNKFNIDFDLSQASLDRGPGNYITLQFDSPSIQALNVKVREAIKEAIAAGEFDRSHLYTNGTGTDKLDLDIKPHITVGILDVEESPQIPWANKHKDIKAFYNKEKTAQFEQLFRTKAQNEFRNLRVSFPVTSIDLLGTDTTKCKVPQKEYLTLATCGLATETKPLNAYAQPLQKPDYLERRFQTLSLNKPKEDYAIAKIREMATDIIYKMNLDLAFKLDKDETGQQLINVGFKDYNDAKLFLSFADKQNTGKIWNLDGRHWVRLGKKRMEHLFGANGEQLYRQGIASFCA